MKAYLCKRYGPPEVLVQAEIPRPNPKDDEILIKIHATSVTASDVIVRGFKMSRWNPIGILMGLVLGFRKPRNSVLGMIVAGEIIETGRKVSLWNKGDTVYGWTLHYPMRMQFGSFAEYICLHEKSTLAHKPPQLSFEEAAAIPYGSLLAYFFIRKMEITEGDSVLIYGASGAIGSAAVQLAKHLGASVTAVCGTSNLEWVKALGANRVIDYTKEDSLPPELKFKHIFDAAGDKKTSRLKEKCKENLVEGGKYSSVDKGSPQLNPSDLQYLTELVKKEKLKPVIDKVFTFDQMVDAHRQVDTGHKKGNVIVRIQN